MGYEIIDADTHILEPPNIWRKHLARQYQRYAPKLVKDHEGGDGWSHGGGTPDPIGLVSTPGKRFEEFRWFGVSYDEIRPACYRGKDRIKDMDIDGVDATVIFPPERTIFRWLGQPDPEVSLAGIDAYNQFAFEDFAAADRTRLFPMYQIPSLGVSTAVQYAKKAAQAGAKGVLLGSWPNGSDGIEDVDDKFWAACVEYNLPVHVHIMLESRENLLRQTSGLQTATTGLQAIAARKRAIASYAGVFARVTPVISQFIFTGVFDRFPSLQVVFVEIGVGWIPHFLEMMDDRYWRNRHWVGFDLKEQPSYYWHKNCAATFMHDHSGIALRHAVGVQNMLWSTDNPHHGNDWPYSRKYIAEQMHTVDPIERDLLIAGNAVRIYHLEKMAPGTDGASSDGAAPAVRVTAGRASKNGARRTSKTGARRTAKTATRTRRRTRAR